MIYNAYFRSAMNTKLPGSNNDSFLYDCDEVPFDEIPPEPGREIQESGYGDLVIHVQKDSHNVNANNYDGVSKASSNVSSSIKRTIHQSSNQVIRRSFSHPEVTLEDYLDADLPRKRKHFTPDKSPKIIYSMTGRDADARNSHSIGHKDFKHQEDLKDSYHHTFKTRILTYQSQSKDNHVNSSDDFEVNRNQKYTAQQIRDFQTCDQNSDKGWSTGRKIKDSQHHETSNENLKYTAQQLRDSRMEKNDHKYTAQQLRDLKYDGSETRHGGEPLYNFDTRGSSWTEKTNQCDIITPKIKTDCDFLPHQNERPPPPCKIPYKSEIRQTGQHPFERLGPPVNKSKIFMRKSPTNFIERNKVSGAIPKNKTPIVGNKVFGALPKNKRPIAGGINKKVIKSTTSIDSLAKQKSQIKKVSIHNPISKAKQRAVTHKTNLSKNIALNKKNIANNKMASASKDSGSNAITDLIQGILSEPEVKEMINSIAHQTVSSSPSNFESPCTSKSSLDADTSRILDRANHLIDTNFKDIDADEFQTNRKIPLAKSKHVKLNLYCKDCRLEFPTTMLRDLHYKTEMHCFVNGDWWKFNPTPPPRTPKHKYPFSIFCIICWDIVRLQSAAVFEKHMTGKRHKTNKQKFGEIFGHSPKHEWCMWEELSLNFRNNFVPVPSQLRNTMHPEYFYDQRVIRK